MGKKVDLRRGLGKESTRINGRRGDALLFEERARQKRDKGSRKRPCFTFKSSSLTGYFVGKDSRSKVLEISLERVSRRRNQLKKKGTVQSRKRIEVKRERRTPENLWLGTPKRIGGKKGENWITRKTARRGRGGHTRRRGVRNRAREKSKQNEKGACVKKVILEGGDGRLGKFAREVSRGTCGRQSSPGSLEKRKENQEAQGS